MDEYQWLIIDNKVRKLVQDLLEPTVRRAQQNRKAIQKLKKVDEQQQENIKDLNTHTEQIDIKLLQIDELTKRVYDIQAGIRAQTTRFNSDRDMIMSELQGFTQRLILTEEGVGVLQNQREQMKSDIGQLTLGLQYQKVQLQNRIQAFKLIIRQRMVASEKEIETHKQKLNSHQNNLKEINYFNKEIDVICKRADRVSQNCRETIQKLKEGFRKLSNESEDSINNIREMVIKFDMNARKAYKNMSKIVFNELPVLQFLDLMDVIHRVNDNIKQKKKFSEYEIGVYNDIDKGKLQDQVRERIGIAKMRTVEVMEAESPPTPEPVVIVQQIQVQKKKKKKKKKRRRRSSDSQSYSDSRSDSQSRSSESSVQESEQEDSEYSELQEEIQEREESEEYEESEQFTSPPSTQREQIGGVVEKEEVKEKVSDQIIEGQKEEIIASMQKKQEVKVQQKKITQRKQLVQQKTSVKQKIQEKQQEILVQTSQNLVFLQEEQIVKPFPITKNPIQQKPQQPIPQIPQKKQPTPQKISPSIPPQKPSQSKPQPSKKPQIPRRILKQSRQPIRPAIPSQTRVSPVPKLPSPLPPHQIHRSSTSVPSKPSRTLHPKPFQQTTQKRSIKQSKSKKQESSKRKPQKHSKRESRRSKQDSSRSKRRAKRQPTPPPPPKPPTPPPPPPDLTPQVEALQESLSSVSKEVAQQHQKVNDQLSLYDRIFADQAVAFKKYDQGFESCLLSMQNIEKRTREQLEMNAVDMDNLTEKIGMFKLEFEANEEYLDIKFNDFKKKTGEQCQGLAVQLESALHQCNSIVHQRKRENSDNMSVYKKIRSQQNQIKKKEKQKENEIENLKQVLQQIIQYCRISVGLTYQDQEDKDGISLLGLKEKHKRSSSTMNKTPKSKDLISLDNKCFSCSGQQTSLMGAFKLACLAYAPSKVVYNNQIFQRKELLDIQSKILQGAWTNSVSDLRDLVSNRGKSPSFSEYRPNSDFGRIYSPSPLITSQTPDLPPIGVKTYRIQ